MFCESDEHRMPLSSRIYLGYINPYYSNAFLYFITNITHYKYIGKDTSKGKLFIIISYSDDNFKYESRCTR